MTLTGLDILARENFDRCRGQRIGVLCNQASIARDFRHVIEILLPLHRSGELTLGGVFGPQHGLFGHTQDNMIEWSGGRDERTGLSVFSLYGEHRKPTPEMLSGLDVLVIDLPDIGARYYTFIWTMFLCIEACVAAGIPLMILDRPNPIGGMAVEGPVLDPAFASFVGLFPLPIRHGMTIGELARFFQVEAFDGAGTVETVVMAGWWRSMSYEQTALPWVMPSPNMPTMETATVYPGGCLLEGTNLSEGRGTTKPFEQLGAPFIDGWDLAADLNGLDLAGCLFRAVDFQPTSGKWAGERCGGVFVHVLDRAMFRPVLTYLAILQQIRRRYGEKLEWREGPYEYEYLKRPIDVIAGNAWLAEAIDELRPLADIDTLMNEGVGAFVQRAETHKSYPPF